MEEFSSFILKTAWCPHKTRFQIKQKVDAVDYVIAEIPLKP